MTMIYVSSTIALGLLILAFIRKPIFSNVNNESYFFANRSLNSFMLGLTLMATQVGGGIIVGVCDAAFQLGLMGYSYALGQILGLLFVLVFFSNAFQNLKLQTTSEIFTKVYQSPKLRKITSVLSAISLFLILVAQAVAVKKLFIALGFSSYTPLFILWGAVVAYTALGGFSAVVKTDVVQILLILVGLFVLGFNIPTADYTEVFTSLQVSSNFNFNQVANYIVWPFCYILIEQDMVQRFGASKSASQIKQAIIISIVGIGAIAFLPMTIGIISKLNGLSIAPESSVLIEFSQQFLPSGLTSVIIFILLMAIVSTVDSLLCAVSSLISCDSLISFGKNEYFKNSIITFLIGFLALFGGLLFESVLKMLVFSYGLTASALFVPVLIALMKWSENTRAACIAFVSGVTSYCFLSLWNESWTVLALIFSGLGFGVGLIWNKVNQ